MGYPQLPIRLRVSLFASDLSKTKARGRLSVRALYDRLLLRDYFAGAMPRAAPLIELPPSERSSTGADFVRTSLCAS